MTRFWREGFFRTNMYGTTSWVEGHWVDRDDWSRYSAADSINHARGMLDAYGARGSASASLVVPNAECPVCGANVFFYRNEHGSRVFFDELGPPWPKHPCTDSSGDGGRDLRSGGNPDSQVEYVLPQARSSVEIGHIRAFIDAAYEDPESTFRTRFGQRFWGIARIKRRFRCNSGVCLILETLGKAEVQQWFAVCKSLPKNYRDGAVISFQKREFSVIEMRSLMPKTIVFNRIKGPRAFLDTLAQSPE